MAEFVGITRVKNEARWIDKCLQSMLRLCSLVIVLDDHSTDQTVAIADGFSNTVVIPSPFENFNEARDKDFLLRQVLVHKPDWIIMIDGDEELEPKAVTELPRLVNAHKDRPYSVFSMPILYLWNDPQTVRVDGVYGVFTRPSAFRLVGEDVSKLEFNKTGGPNLHCSNFPQGLRGSIVQVPIRIKHYGYMDPVDRQRKYDWYNSIDPGNPNEDGYLHIIEKPNRHAPGPVQLVPWRD